MDHPLCILIRLTEAFESVVEGDISPQSHRVVDSVRITEDDIHPEGSAVWYVFSFLTSTMQLFQGLERTLVP